MIGDPIGDSCGRTSGRFPDAQQGLEAFQLRAVVGCPAGNHQAFNTDWQHRARTREILREKVLLGPLRAAGDHGHLVDPNLWSGREIAEGNPSPIQVIAKGETLLERPRLERRQVAGHVCSNLGLHAQFEESVVDCHAIAIQTEIRRDGQATQRE